MEEPQMIVSSRLQWISLLSDLLKESNMIKRSPEILARALESYAHCHIREVLPIGSDVNVCRYGSVDVLDLDCETTHAFHAISNYNACLSRVVCAIANGNTEYLDVYEPSQWFALNEEKVSLNTAHSEWEKKFFAQQELSRSILLGKTAATTGIFQCGRCNSYDIDTEQKQTRSSDEPMTIFCTCNSCGKRFVI
jgi:DNA-directed RNA polymerase subunit M/transcription elongation factor TFIIS